MQEIQIRSLIQEDPTCCEAAKSVSYNYGAWSLELVHNDYWAHMLQPLKPVCPTAGDPQQEKPPQWTACELQGRVASTYCI